MKAIAVFNSDGCHFLDRLLKPGFTHCFVSVETGDIWVCLDGRDGRPVIDIVCDSAYALAEFYREQEGYTVVETEQRGQAPLFPFVTANCVGLVKAVLCINSPFVVTPWQLYKNLTAPDRGSLLPGKSIISPKKPKVPRPIAPTSVERDDPEIAAKRDELRRSELRRRGRAATILTGGANLDEVGAPLGRASASGSTLG